MRRLSRRLLARALQDRGLRLSSLAKGAGISRQSVYKMLSGASIYNVPFQKIVTFLGCNPEGVTEEKSRGEASLEMAPPRIQKTVLEMRHFAERHRVTLILFGSRARGETRSGADWDFGMFFWKKEPGREFRELKARVQEGSFPYRVDLVKLNGAPDWFRQGVVREGLILCGRRLPQGERSGREAA